MVLPAVFSTLLFIFGTQTKSHLHTINLEA